MPEEALELRAADGAPLSALWRRPAGKGPFPAVLCVHGLTLDKSLFDLVAAGWEGLGLASLRVDLRGHGGSGGELKQQGFEDQLSDVRTSADALATLPGADPARRGLLGFSMGAALGALVAAGAGMGALALWSPLLRTGPWDGSREGAYGPAQGGYRPLWDGILVHERLFTEASGRDPYAAALAFGGPLMVCHGGKDRNHPQAAAVDLAAARAGASAPVAAYFPPASGHRWHPEAERRTRDALTGAFFLASL